MKGGLCMPDNRIYYQQPVLPIHQPGSRTASKNIDVSSHKTSFTEVLEKELTQVKFSQHALQRLQTRNIKLDNSELDKLNQAVEKAAQKGAKESLILMNNDLAFVVSVKNKTVITAMDGSSIKDNVFTNIDSAVII